MTKMLHYDIQIYKYSIFCSVHLIVYSLLYEIDYGI